MPRDQTMVTELGTALGMLEGESPAAVLARRPPALRIEPDRWDRLAALQADPTTAADFAPAFANGRTFLGAAEGLRGRPPRLIEWTGGRRPPGDEVAPIDLRVDHVYLVSCKYLSDNVSSPSPARLFDGLLARGRWDRRDWYEVTAPEEYQALYEASLKATALDGYPARAEWLEPAQRRALRAALPGRRYPDAVRPAYEALCRAVSERSARRWRDALAAAGPGAGEALLWRLLRIGNAPYFILGAEAGRRLTLRVDTPWDWREQFSFRALSIDASDAGQPQVEWRARYRRQGSTTEHEVAGHVEIRWSHGKFSQQPEAKVYVDTRTDAVPGYHPLGEPSGGAPPAPDPQPALFG